MPGKNNIKKINNYTWICSYKIIKIESNYQHHKVVDAYNVVSCQHQHFARSQVQYGMQEMDCSSVDLWYNGAEKKHCSWWDVFSSSGSVGVKRGFPGDNSW